MEQYTLRDLLTERNIRMDAAAALAGVSTSTISRICSGAEQARPKTVIALAQALGMSARRMRALCDVTYDAAHSQPPVNGPWCVWVWNERIRLWVRVDEGSEEDMKESLSCQRSAAARFAMSKSGEPLPEPPADIPARETPQQVAP